MEITREACRADEQPSDDRPLLLERSCGSIGSCEQRGSNPLCRRLDFANQDRSTPPGGSCFHRDNVDLTDAINRGGPNLSDGAPDGLPRSMGQKPSLGKCLQMWGGYPGSHIRGGINPNIGGPPKGESTLIPFDDYSVKSNYRLGQLVEETIRAKGIGNLYEPTGVDRNVEGMLQRPTTGAQRLGKVTPAFRAISNRREEPPEKLAVTQLRVLADDNSAFSKQTRRWVEEPTDDPSIDITITAG